MCSHFVVCRFRCREKNLKLISEDQKEGCLDQPVTKQEAGQSEIARALGLIRAVSVHSLRSLSCEIEIMACFTRSLQEQMECWSQA